MHTCSRNITSTLLFTDYSHKARDALETRCETGAQVFTGAETLAKVFTGAETGIMVFQADLRRIYSVSPQLET